MEHFRLRVFGAVYSLGSYTEAARELGITQPAVSQNIAELEKELGTELFVRGSAVSGGTGVSGDVGSAGASVSGAASSSMSGSAGFAAAKGSVGTSMKGGKMTPTPAAELFWAMAQGVLRGYREIGVMFSPEAASYEVVRISVDRSASEYVLPRVMDILHAAHPKIRFEVLTPADAETSADVTITTVPIRQGGTLTLRFEAYGPADPFVDAVRLILTEFC